ncbi:MAG: glycosyltransferase [Chloroflexi bacterium]|nr:MAG: glycosyltransferase [Chloroflexota bacterium]
MIAPGRRPSILLLGNVLTPGGTEGQFVEIACGLDRSRWDLHVGCVRAEGPLRTKLEAAGLRVLSCVGGSSFKSPRFAASVLRLASFLRAHRIRLIHSFDFYSNLLGVPAARLARVPVVIASQRDLGDLRPPLQRRLHNVVLGLADRVAVNAEIVAEGAAKTGIVASSRIVVIPNGVDTARFCGAPVETRPPGRVIVGTVAMLRPEKGLMDLVRAAGHVVDHFPEARFLIWGEGPLRLPLEALIRELGLSGVVTIAGATLEPETTLRRMDIFVLPSLSEACSNSLLEAMATGRPIVATRVGGTPALVEDEATGLLVPPADPAALAKAVIRLIEEPALAARLAARAQQRARAEFGIDRMLERIEGLYHQALSWSAGGFAVARAESRP